MYKSESLPKFDHQFKKFYSKEKEIIREEIKNIESNPTIGELKKGSLANVRVHKFKLHHQLYLLAYELNTKEKIIYLYTIGTHENFYEVLKRYKDTI